MKFILLIIFSISAQANQPIPLPKVETEVRRVLDATKDNPLTDCLTPQMFSTQSPLKSSKDIGNCVKTKVTDLGHSKELKNVTKEAKSWFDRLRDCAKVILSGSFDCK